MVDNISLGAVVNLTHESTEKHTWSNLAAQPKSLSSRMRLKFVDSQRLKHV